MIEVWSDSHLLFPNVIKAWMIYGYSQLFPRNGSLVLNAYISKRGCLGQLTWAVDIYNKTDFRKRSTYMIYHLSPFTINLMRRNWLLGFLQENRTYLTFDNGLYPEIAVLFIHWQGRKKFEIWKLRQTFDFLAPLTVKLKTLPMKYLDKVGRERFREVNGQAEQ